MNLLAFFPLNIINEKNSEQHTIINDCCSLLLAIVFNQFKYLCLLYFGYMYSLILNT